MVRANRDADILNDPVFRERAGHGVTTTVDVPEYQNPSWRGRRCGGKTERIYTPNKKRDAPSRSRDGPSRRRSSLIPARVGRGASGARVLIDKHGAQKWRPCDERALRSARTPARTTRRVRFNVIAISEEHASKVDQTYISESRDWDAYENKRF